MQNEIENIKMLLTIKYGSQPYVIEYIDHISIRILLKTEEAIRSTSGLVEYVMKTLVLANGSNNLKTWHAAYYNPTETIVGRQVTKSL